MFCLIDFNYCTAVLAGNALQRQMLEIQGKMLTELRRTTDQLEKVEVAIRRQRAPRPPAPTWNRPRFQRQPQRFRSPTKMSINYPFTLSWNFTRSLSCYTLHLYSITNVHD
jgi:hypothetical protein